MDDEFEPTVMVERDGYHGDIYVDVRRYDGENPQWGMIAEVEVRSGNAATDGLVVNTACVRLTGVQVVALRDALNEIIWRD